MNYTVFNEVTGQVYSYGTTRRTSLKGIAPAGFKAIEGLPPEGRGDLYYIDVETMEYVPVPDMPKYHIFDFETKTVVHDKRKHERALRWELQSKLLASDYIDSPRRRARMSEEKLAKLDAYRDALLSRLEEPAFSLDPLPEKP